MPTDLIGAVLSVAMLLVLFLLVLFLAYCTARLAGKRFSPMQSSGSIRVIDRVALGSDRMLCIVEVGGKTLLLGVTQHQIGLLGELASDQLRPTTEAVNASFSSILTDATAALFHRGKKPSTKEGAQYAADPDQDAR